MRIINYLIDGWEYAVCPPQGDLPPQAAAWEPVTLPHVWNLDAANAEGPRAYRCTLNLAPASGRETFLCFEGVGGACRVWLNGILLGQHKGGYSRFCLPMAGAVREGANQLVVLTDNTRDGSWIPTGGDFNNFGGIYRPVSVIETADAHFDLLYYGTCGVELDADPAGTVTLKARLSGKTEGTTVEYTLWDGQTLCAKALCPAAAPATLLRVEEPHLWDGIRDPHLYLCRASLVRGEEILDQVELPFGFRRAELTPDKGFFLNGKHMTICGVSKHQDRAGCACGVTEADQEEDIAIIRELGANAVRLSHYQHPAHTYDLCDQAGLVVWAEIPLLALPDGNEPLFENARQQLTELILQNKHHPSICFWGLENEIAIHGESLEMYRKVAELNTYAHDLDAHRPTTLANLYCVRNNSQLNQITDMVGYNIYYGWYYGKLTDYGPFLDKFHTDNPQVCVGISEYGADCSVNLHRDDPKVGDYSEEFQCVYHEAAYPAFRARDFVWGSFVWNMFDFASGIRTIGDMKGLNCKGLVTYDRKTRKDTFYYYKTWWSEESFVHLCGRRYARRCGETTTVKVYANVPEVTLSVNGQVVGTQAADKVFVFENLPLQWGENTITVTAGDLQDEMTLTRVTEPEKSYIYDNPNPGFNVENWFTLEQGEEDLFPADRFSIMDEMGVLSADPDAWALLEAEVPKITGDPRGLSMPRMSLLRIINRMSSQFTEDFVKELNRKLNQIPKKEGTQQ